MIPLWNYSLKWGHAEVGPAPAVTGNMREAREGERNASTSRKESCRGAARIAATDFWPIGAFVLTFVKPSPNKAHIKISPLKNSLLSSFGISNYLYPCCFTDSRSVHFASQNLCFQYANWWLALRAASGHAVMKWVLVLRCPISNWVSTCCNPWAMARQPPSVRNSPETKYEIRYFLGNLLILKVKPEPHTYERILAIWATPKASQTHMLGAKSRSWGVLQTFGAFPCESHSLHHEILPMISKLLNLRRRDLILPEANQ